MIQPIMTLKLDKPMLEFLAQEIAALTLLAEDGRYNQEYASSLHHFNQQLVLQMEEQGVTIGEEEEEGLLTYTFIPAEQRVPTIPVRTSFMYDDKPIGEIVGYNNVTGKVTINVLDKEFIKKLKESGVDNFYIEGEASSDDL